MVDDISDAEASGVRATGTGHPGAASRIGETVTSGGATRRTILRGALLAGVATPLLAACADDVGISDEDTSTEEKSTSAEPPTGGGNGAESEGGNDTEPEGDSAGAAVAKTSDVPEGGGVILEDDGVVITQPVAGTFNGFSNICTHQGCPLFDVTETINCNCHGSKFSIDDGSVVSGPAEKPLPTQGLVVSGNEITLG
jgi:Rieske Fe-S protein